MIARRIAPALASLVLLAAGCVSSEPAAEGVTFEVALAARGTGRRQLMIDVSRDGATGRNRTVDVSDVTQGEDDIEARRVVRIEESRVRGEPRPGGGHVEMFCVAVRPLDLVIDFRGRTDLYHLTFPRDGGVLVEPQTGAFTHVVVRR